MLRLVPFNDVWIDHDRLDLKAIYRRPEREENDEGEMVQKRDADGLPIWNLTTPLSVKLHNAWKAKGFEYVTLANRESLVMAARKGTLIGGSVKDYDQHATGGPWNYRKYIAGQSVERQDAVDQLKQDVAEFGPEAVEKLRQRTDPAFRLPDALKTPKAKKGTAA